MRKYILFTITLLIMKSSIFAMLRDDYGLPGAVSEAASGAGCNSVTAFGAASEDSVIEPTPRSLVFLDEEQSPDMLNFLETKYPRHPLTKRTDLLKTKNEKMQRVMIALQQANVTYEIYVELRWLNFLSQKLTAEDNPQALKLKEKQELISYFKFNKHSSFPRVYQHAQLNENRRYIDDIILGAQWIDFIRQEHGEFPVVFLGRTPCFLQVAYEELCKKESPENPNCCDHIYHLNFSGSPDIENTRDNFVYTSDKRKTIARNLVTTERRDFYCEYMTRKGMDRIGPKFYLVDMISTGGGLNSALRTMRFYYEQHLGVPMPDIHFMGLALPLEENYSTQLYTYEARASRITFNNLPELGVRPLVMKASPIYVNYRTIDNLLDNDPFQRAALHGIEFPAEEWDQESETALQEGGRFHQNLYGKFRSQVQEIISVDPYL